MPVVSAMTLICGVTVDVLVGLFSFPVLCLIVGPIATKDKALASGVLINC